MAWKSAARPAGSGTMSTLPSSAVATLRNSSTTQSVPTPRQSQLNDPSHSRIAAASWSADSCSFLPSVSKIACRKVAGLVWNIRCASRSHSPIAVPPFGWRPPSARLASARVVAVAVASHPFGGNAGRA